MEHTKTPWEVFAYEEEYSSLGIRQEYAIIPATKAQGFISYIALLNGPDAKQKQANAARIVHCVNSHDKLVEALRAVINGAKHHVACIAGENGNRSLSCDCYRGIAQAVLAEEDNR